MKKLCWYGGLWLAVGLCLHSLYAASIIKTNTGDLSYFNRLQIFGTGENTVRGWVKLNGGFALSARASAFMDTFISVTGPMDLGETGTLVLSGNLFLDGKVTLTSGGNIKGKPSVSGAASTIFMGGDLVLGADTYARIIHITGDWSNSGTSGDLIIDGMGHTLDIQDRAQIFVDQNVTLTLRNMTIKTGPKSLNNPAIQLASLGSKLALDNVMFDLGADFHFITGQIFVHNEVAVTGTSAFVYQSPKPSYITSGATWSFEEGSTFNVAPATYTDLPYTAGTATSNNFIVLADQSSALSLNGCSFKTTFTGLRLTKGMVLFDNQVAVDTQAALDLPGTTPATILGTAGTGTFPKGVAWSPDGRFLAVANYNSDTMWVYRFNGNSGPTFLGTVGTGDRPDSVAWSPDGRFLAVVNFGETTNGLQIYRFNGSSAPTSMGTVATGSGPISVSWSPDGRFLAVANYNETTNALQIYRFNGSSTPTSIGTAATDGPTSCVSWSPDGRFLALVNFGMSTVWVYRFNGSSAPKFLSSVGSGANPISVAWSPDGRFFAKANWGGNAVQVYSFNGNGTPILVGAQSTGTNPYFVTWSPDGGFLAVVNNFNGAGGNSLQLYRFNGNGNPVVLGTAITTDAEPAAVAWSPNGQYIAVVNDIGNSLQIFSCNYTGQVNQAFSTGLVFGDSAKGSNFDATVKIMGNARVGFRGKISDDSA